MPDKPTDRDIDKSSSDAFDAEEAEIAERKTEVGVGAGAERSPGEMEKTLAEPRDRRRLVVVTIVAIVAVVAVVVLLVLRRGEPATTTEVKVNAEAGEAGHGDEHGAGEEVTLAPEAREAAGIEIEGVTERPAVAILKLTGTVEANQQQTQQVTPLVSGRVEQVRVGLGDHVVSGSVIAVISSPEVAEMHGKLREAETRLNSAQRNLQRVQRAESRVAILQAQARLDEADATLRRTRRLIELGAGAGKDLVAAEAAQKSAKAEYEYQSNISLSRDVQQAQAEVDASRTEVTHLRQSLGALGASIPANDTSGNISLVTVRAPVSGKVVDRLVNPGAGVQPGSPMFTVANVSTVWVMANVPEAHMPLIRTGAAAEVRSASLGNQVLYGRVNYIDPRIMEETRTGRARVELQNPGERLRAGMFVEVGFQAGTGGSGRRELVVKEEAIQRIGDRTVVFMPKEGEENAFEVRDVKIGAVSDGYVRLLEGLQLGDKVVTKGSFTLKTQSQKGEMGEHGH